MAEYQHTVVAVYNPEDAMGFLYTVGLHEQGRNELFALNVPRGMATLVADSMNFLSTRTVLPNQTALCGPMLCRILPVSNKSRKQLMRSHLCQMDKAADVLALSILSVCEECASDAPPLPPCSCCGASTACDNK